MLADIQTLLLGFYECGEIIFDSLHPVGLLINIHVLHNIYIVVISHRVILIIPQPVLDSVDLEVC